MWPNLKIVTRVASFSHQVWNFKTPNMMFGVSNHLTLNHASFSQLQPPSVVFGFWNDSKSPDMGDRWFAGVLNQHKVRIWQNKRQDVSQVTSLTKSPFGPTINVDVIYGLSGKLATGGTYVANARQSFSVPLMTIQPTDRPLLLLLISSLSRG